MYFSVSISTNRPGGLRRVSENGRWQLWIPTYSLGVARQTFHFVFVRCPQTFEVWNTTPTSARRTHVPSQISVAFCVPERMQLKMMKLYRILSQEWRLRLTHWLQLKLFSLFQIDQSRPEVIESSYTFFGALRALARLGKGFPFTWMWLSGNKRPPPHTLE